WRWQSATLTLPSLLPISSHKRFTASAWAMSWPSGRGAGPASCSTTSAATTGSGSGSNGVAGGSCGGSCTQATTSRPADSRASRDLSSVRQACSAVTLEQDIPALFRVPPHLFLPAVPAVVAGTVVLPIADRDQRRVERIGDHAHVGKVQF